MGDVRATAGPEGWPIRLATASGITEGSEPPQLLDVRNARLFRPDLARPTIGSVKRASRLDSISESVTLSIAARAARLRAAGEDIVSLAAGEPDFPPPVALRDAAHRWIDSGNGRYTPTSGRPELRSLLASVAQTQLGLELGASNVLVSAGTKPALSVALLGLLEPGDEVVVLAPYWVSYPDLVRLAGGVPRFVTSTEADGFAPDPASIAREVARPRCRALILNSPNNPTGRVWSAADVERLVDTCRKHGVTILSDEIYSKLAFGREVVSPAAFDPKLETTLVFDGLSKSHAIPGWRLGWVLGPESFIAAMASVQSQILGNACSISQEAALSAFEAGALEETRAMVLEFTARRDHISALLADLPGFTLHRPEGAFYALPGVGRVLELTGTNDVQLAERILHEAKVAIVPGSAFGAPGHLRFSFAANRTSIDEAIRRLRAWLDTHAPKQE